MLHPNSSSCSCSCFALALLLLLPFALIPALAFALSSCSCLPLLLLCSSPCPALPCPALAIALALLLPYPLTPAQLMPLLFGHHSNKLNHFLKPKQLQLLSLHVPETNYDPIWILVRSYFNSALCHEKYGFIHQYAKKVTLTFVISICNYCRMIFFMLF